MNAQAISGRSQTSQRPVSVAGWSLMLVTGASLWAVILHVANVI